MKKILSYLQNVENAIMIITFCIMVLASFAQVVNRNIFKLPISWFDEVSTYSMIYMALLGTEMGLRDGTQVSVSAVVDKLKGKVKKVVQIIAKIIVVIFSATIFYSSIGMLQKQISTGQTSPALKLPMSVPYAALTISFAIISIVQIVALVGMVLYKNNEEEVA
jgi:C4-dicarboxylate transporter DctQ subunit